MIPNPNIIGGFTYENTTRDDLERIAGWVSLTLVITRYHPDIAANLNPNLGRTEHVAGRMQRYPGIIDRQLLSIGKGLYPVAHPQDEGQPARLRTQVGVTARPRMIAMGMGNDRPLDRAPWIYMEISGGTVESPVISIEDRSAQDVSSAERFFKELRFRRQRSLQ